MRKNNCYLELKQGEEAMEELFRLSAHISPITLRDADTGAIIAVEEKAGKDTAPDDGVVIIKIIKRPINGREGEEIIFLLRHPKAEEDITVTPQDAKKIRSGKAESPVTREEFLKLWPDGITHFLFLLSQVEKFLKTKPRGYEPATDKWIMNLLG